MITPRLLRDAECMRAASPTGARLRIAIATPALLTPIHEPPPTGSIGTAAMMPPACRHAGGHASGRLRRSSRLHISLNPLPSRGTIVTVHIGAVLLRQR